MVLWEHCLGNPYVFGTLFGKSICLLLPSLSPPKRPGAQDVLYVCNPYRFNIFLLVCEDVWEEIKRDFKKEAWYAWPQSTRKVEAS